MNINFDLGSVEIMTEYEKYIRRMEEIRVLSTPTIDDISDADEYSKRLRSLKREAVRIMRLMLWSSLKMAAYRRI